jgi:hypothetical protein
LIDVSVLSNWAQSATSGEIVNGAYRLRPNQAASTVKVPVTPGQSVECLFAVRSGVDATSGDNGFYLGPMTQSADNQILNWWQEHPSISAAEGVRAGSVKITAPDNAAFISVGFHGPAKEGSDGAVDLVSLRLVVIQVLRFCNILRDPMEGSRVSTRYRPQNRRRGSGRVPFEGAVPLAADSV